MRRWSTHYVPPMSSASITGLRAMPSKISNILAFAVFTRHLSLRLYESYSSRLISRVFDKISNLAKRSLLLFIDTWRLWLGKVCSLFSLILVKISGLSVNKLFLHNSENWCSPSRSACRILSASSVFTSAPGLLCRWTEKLDGMSGRIPL